MATKNDKRIDRIEREDGRVWVYLKPGFILRGERTHAICEDTQREALDNLSLVEPCACAECISLQGSN